MQRKSIDLKEPFHFSLTLLFSEQFEDIRDKFAAIQDRVDENPLHLADLFPPEPSPETVMQRWNMLRKIITTYIETVRNVDSDDDSD